jgi:hypothetical protein
MQDRDKRNGPDAQATKALWWVLAAMAAVICTMALLHLAVQRERAAAAVGQVDFQLLPEVFIGAWRATSPLLNPDSAPASLMPSKKPEEDDVEVFGCARHRKAGMGGGVGTPWQCAAATAGLSGTDAGATARMLSRGAATT